MAKHLDKKRELGSKVVRWCDEVLWLPDYALVQPILRQARAATRGGGGGKSKAKALFVYGDQYAAKAFLKVCFPR